MIDLMAGFSGMFINILAVILITEINILVEESLQYKYELRKGFRKKLQTQLLFFFRNSRSFVERLVSAVILFPTFYAVSMLPLWGEKPLFNPSHSFWLFILVMLSAPLIQFFLQLAFYESRGQVLAVRLQEKTMAGFALLLMVVVSFTMLTAADDISEIMELQKNTWLVAGRPSSVILFLSFLVVIYFLCQQKIFSKSHHSFSERESEGTKFFFGIWKTSWLLFVACIFLGGGTWSIFLKVIIMNLFSVLFFEGFSRLREDQAETLVIWEITPLLMFFVLVSLVLIGFRI